MTRRQLHAIQSQWRALGCFPPGGRGFVSLSSPVKGILCISEAGLMFAGLLGAGFERFGSQEKLRTQPLEHLFEVRS